MVKLALEYSATRVILLGETFARRNIDVESDNITGLELPLSDRLSWGDLVNDDIVAVDHVSLHLVRENTLDCIALEFFGNLLDDLGDLSVGGSLGDFALGSLEGIPSGKDCVGLTTCNWCVSDHNCGGGV